MKRKTAREILAESFQELAGSRAIDRITVREIVENCGYSMATFYRQFQDKYDLMAWAYSRDMEKIYDRGVYDRDTWRQMEADVAAYYHQNRKYLANLLAHTHGYDSFVRYMSEYHYNFMKNAVLSISGASELEEKTEMLIRSYVLGGVSLSCEWILGKYTCGPETLAEIYERSMPDALQQYLR